ncbi:MAG TPA: hypothetical protein VNX18_21365 [Bryobacteraceae bacterium]|nr:hypothetical protein [Bryobacteraceae bacterium]
MRHRIAWGALAVLAAFTVYGFVHENLFAQELWRDGGLGRWAWFTAAFWTAAAILLWSRPSWLLPMAAGIALVYTEWWCWNFFDPLAPVAVLYFLGSCFFLGRWVTRKADAIKSLLVGLAGWIFVISIAVHFNVNRSWVYWVAFALPYAMAREKLAIPKTLPHMALLIYVLMMHWLVTLKPEVSSDGLAMHLAIPGMIAHQGKFAFDFQHYAWAVMPMGGDFAFTAVYLLGGEMAARLLNFALLVVIVAMVYQGSRRWLTPERAAIGAALFASTPLVQLVTGSLFVENVWAAFIAGAVMALWQGEVAWAGLLFGAASATKVGTTAFLAPAAVIAAITLRSAQHRARTALAACAMLIVFAAPPYWNAWRKTGNPIFPFANNVFKSPYFDTVNSLKDVRFHVPHAWNALYNLTFRSSDFIEGQKGALGFQYFLLLVPLLLLINRKAPRGPIAVGVAGAILTFASIPNLRYLYPALPLVSIGIAWMISELPALIVAVVILIGLNIWFTPSSGWYHTEFALFTEPQLDAYLKLSAPGRELIEIANRIAPGEPIAVFRGGAIAGLHAEAYEDTWHTYRFWRRLIESPDPEHIAQMFRELHIRYVITPIPAETDFLVVQHFIETLTGPTGKSNGRFQLRSLLNAPVPASRDVSPAPPGSYDDMDQRIEYTGAWLHDRQFAEASSGSITYSNQPGDTLRFPFQGTSIAYVYTRTFNRGYVEVRIDGKPRGDIDLFSKQTRWQQQTVFGGLDSGPHTIELRVSSRKYPSSSDRFVDLDRFVVAP